jgi:hypothetical protein
MQETVFTDMECRLTGLTIIRLFGRPYRCVRGAGQTRGEVNRLWHLAHYEDVPRGNKGHARGIGAFRQLNHIHRRSPAPANPPAAR